MRASAVAFLAIPSLTAGSSDVSFLATCALHLSLASVRALDLHPTLLHSTDAQATCYFQNPQTRPPAPIPATPITHAHPYSTFIRELYEFDLKDADLPVVSGVESDAKGDGSNRSESANGTDLSSAHPPILPIVMIAKTRNYLLTVLLARFHGLNLHIGPHVCASLREPCQKAWTLCHVQSVTVSARKSGASHLSLCSTVRHKRDDRRQLLKYSMYRKQVVESRSWGASRRAILTHQLEAMRPGHSDIAIRLVLTLVGRLPLVIYRLNLESQLINILSESVCSPHAYAI